MKRISADENAVVFQLSVREHNALIEILRSYPVIPPAHQLVSKELKGARVAECQRLLNEALAEERAAHKRHLHAWLTTRERLQKNKMGWRFTLAHADSEWLLQVLNDIRVGNWLRLGSPDPGELNPQRLDAGLLPAVFAMEMSGYFQMNILDALEN